LEEKGGSYILPIRADDRPRQLDQVLHRADCGVGPEALAGRVRSIVSRAVHDRLEAGTGNLGADRVPGRLIWGFSAKAAALKKQE
jgi:hypothetical protein